MNENTNNLTQPKQPRFYSKLYVTKDIYDEFSQLNYIRLKKTYIVYLVISVLAFISAVFNHSLTYFVLDVLVLASALSLYFRVNKTTKLGYERLEFSNGGTVSEYSSELYDNRIVTINEKNDKEYSYSAVEKLLETKTLLLLGMKYNMYIMINKSDFSNIEELKAFLLSECKGVKKKEFIDISNRKKVSFVLLIIMTVIVALFAIIGTVLQITHPMFLN